MKRNLMIAILGLVCATAQAGNELGNGGDVYAKEFVSIGREMLKKMERAPDAGVHNLDLLKRAVEETSVITKDVVELNGNPVDAVNYPRSKKIELNRTRWRGYDSEQKSSLVLHEYLGVAEFDDSNYRISGGYSRAGAEIDTVGSRNRFFVGIGSGVHTFYGNIGKLYYSSAPILDIRVGYALSQYFVAKAGFENSTFFFNEAPNFGVRAQLMKMSVSAQYHFLTSKQWTGQAGLDPYVVGGFGKVLRIQDFRELRRRELDNAASAELGLGSSLYFIPRTAAIWVEARAGQIFFKDRNDESYIQSGIPDTTGMLLSGGVGIQYFF